MAYGTCITITETSTASYPEKSIRYEKGHTKDIFFADFSTATVRVKASMELKPTEDRPPDPSSQTLPMIVGVVAPRPLRLEEQLECHWQRDMAQCR